MPATAHLGFFTCAQGSGPPRKVLRAVVLAVHPGRLCSATAPLEQSRGARVADPARIGVRATCFCHRTCPAAAARGDLRTFVTVQVKATAPRLRRRRDGIAVRLDSGKQDVATKRVGRGEAEVGVNERQQGRIDRIRLAEDVLLDPLAQPQSESGVVQCGHP